jgi:hypothetical protein
LPGLITANAADVAAIPDQSDRSIVNNRHHTEGKEAAMSKLSNE